MISPVSASADSWHSVSTEHFEIIYSADDPYATGAAAEVVALAPSVWSKTTSYMRYTPTERISVVLRSDTARANGYFTPLPPHIELFVSSPSRYQLGSRTPNWLELVFTHEMIHYLHLTRPKGFFGFASRLFGPLTAAGSYLFLPGWAVEGPTVYGETALTPGGRGTDPFFEMTWLAPIYADTLYTYDQAGYQSPLPPSGRIYSAGYLMTDYLHRTYGADGYHAINDTFMRLPFLGMRRAVRRVTGTPAPSVFGEMVSEIELRSAERFTLPTGSPVSPTDTDADWHLIASTDAGILAWSAAPRTPGAVYLIDDDTSRPRHLFSVSATDASSVAVNDDLTQAIAAIVHPDYAGAGPRVSYSDLHIIDLSPDAPLRSQRITQGRQLLHPAFIPSSDTIIAVERQGQYSRLVRVTIPGGEITPLYDPGSVRLHAPRVSNDGSLLAVVEHDEGSQDIVVIAVRSGEVVARIGTPQHHEFDPRFITGSPPYRITYGSDEPGYLVVKEVSLIPGENLFGRENPTVVKDPIAAYSATRYGAFYIYQTYRGTGYAIRKQPITRSMSDESHAANRRPERESTSSIASTHEYSPVTDRRTDILPTPLPVPVQPIQGERYVDLPRPVFWFPTVAVSGGSNEDAFTEFGVYALAASVLERHQVEVAAAYNPAAAEPTGEVTYTFQPGAAAWSIAASRGIKNETDERLVPEHAISLIVERPVWYRSSIDRADGLVGSIGTIYKEDEERHISFTGALRLFGARYGASGLFLGGSGGAIQSQVTVTPKILDRSNAEIATQTQLSQRWWIGRSRFYLRPEVTFASSRTEDAVDAIPFVAGRFDSDGNNAIVSAPNALLGRVAISVDLGPYDAAYRGVGSSASLFSLFVEQAAVPGEATVADRPEGQTIGQERSDWRALRSDNYTILGTSLGVDLFFNTIPIRLTGGIALRVPHPGGGGTSAVRFFLNLGGIAADRVSISPE